VRIFVQLQQSLIHATKVRIAIVKVKKYCTVIKETMRKNDNKNHVNDALFFVVKLDAPSVKILQDDDHLTLTASPPECVRQTWITPNYMLIYATSNGVCCH